MKRSATISKVLIFKGGPFPKRMTCEAGELSPAVVILGFKGGPFPKRMTCEAGELSPAVVILGFIQHPYTTTAKSLNFQKTIITLLDLNSHL